jgi:hypothetical protein
MRSRLQRKDAGMESGPASALRQPLAHLMGAQVFDSNGAVIGAVVGRVLAGDQVDLLLRRRRLFRRSVYRRLDGQSIAVIERRLVYDPRRGQGRVMPAVIQIVSRRAEHSTGDKA